MAQYIPAATLEKYVPTARGLAEYAKKALVSPNLYIWGGFGEYLTDDILDEKIARWPDWYTPERVELRRQLCNRGIRGYDCIGLIQAYLWDDYRQGHTYLYKPEEFLTTAELIRMELVKGEMKDLPEKPGLVLWREGHVGVYIGGGEVIECSTRVAGSNVRDYRIGGIHRSRLDDARKWPELEWKYWLEYPGIQY